MILKNDKIIIAYHFKKIIGLPPKLGNTYYHMWIINIYSKTSVKSMVNTVCNNINIKNVNISLLSI
jgi:hypothetical protein